MGGGGSIAFQTLFFFQDPSPPAPNLIPAPTIPEKEVLQNSMQRAREREREGRTIGAAGAALKALSEDWAWCLESCVEMAFNQQPPIGRLETLDVGHQRLAQKLFQAWETFLDNPLSMRAL